MLANLLNRRSKFKPFSVPKFLCFSLKNYLSLLPRKRMTKQEKVMKNGLDKLYQELDIIKILRTLRMVKLFIWMQLA